MDKLSNHANLFACDCSLLSCSSSSELITPVGSNNLHMYFFVETRYPGDLEHISIIHHDILYLLNFPYLPLILDIRYGISHSQWPRHPTFRTLLNNV